MFKVPVYICTLVVKKETEFLRQHMINGDIAEVLLGTRKVR